MDHDALVPSIPIASVTPPHNDSRSHQTTVQPQQQQQPRRRKGILAFLPTHVTQYPYEDAAWQRLHRGGGHAGSSSARRRRNRQQRQRQEIDKHTTTTTGTTCLLDDLLLQHADNRTGMIPTAADVVGDVEEGQQRVLRRKHTVILFLYDPLQPFSLRLLQKLVQVVQLSSLSSSNNEESSDEHDGDDDTDNAGAPTTSGEQPSDRTGDGTMILHALCLSQRGPSCPATQEVLTHSGLYSLDQCRDDDKDHHSATAASPSQPPNSPRTNMAMLQMACGMTVCPSLVFLDGTTGQKQHLTGSSLVAAAEALALDWNPPDHTWEHWRKGRSALTLAQQVRAGLLYPPCTVS